MKTALVTTTINAPTVLCLYRAYGPDVRFFVIGDRKTPHAGVDDLCAQIGNAVYYSPEAQQELGYACSDLIGWNSIQRRNIGFLEALKWGADIIVSIDDDNICMDPSYFQTFERLLLQPFNGLQVITPWFDAGCLLEPPVRHRGFPFEQSFGLPKGATLSFMATMQPAVSMKIGVAAGLWFGDPDIGAVDRLAQYAQARSVSAVGQAGIAIGSSAYTVFNSQNTAFIRELAPAMMMWPGVGRYDDICASLIAQRVMRDLHVHFGPPFVWQQRNQHDLLRDLADEMWGMHHILELSEYLDSADLTYDTDVLPVLSDIYTGLPSFVPSIVKECGLAYLEDCERVMG